MSSSPLNNQINEEFRDRRSPNLLEVIERSLNKLGWFKGAIVPVILLIIWEIASKSGWVAPNLLPAPSNVLGTINDLAKSRIFRIFDWCGSCDGFRCDYRLFQNCT
jgi:sulfonate transport system permease protein